MKKLLILLFLLIFTVSVYAVDVPNRSIFFEGTAAQAAQRQFFMENFAMEASALGFTVTTDRNKAGFLFKFDVQPYSDENNPSVKNIILVTLIYNELNMEMVSFGWPFGELEDMYEYNQYVFYKAAVLIPSLSDEELAELAEQAAKASAEPGVRREAAAADNRWQNQWVYVNFSVNYLFNRFQLMMDHPYAWGGAADWDKWPDPNDEDSDSIVYSIPLDHKFLETLGITVGVEVQPLNFLSLGLNLQIVVGDFTDRSSDPDMPTLNFSAGAELKFNIKLSHVMIQPFGAFTYYLTKEKHTTFDIFPDFAFGGGVEIGTGIGNTGVLFFKLSFMMSSMPSFLGDKTPDTYTHNPYKGINNVWAPRPSTFPFKRTVFGICVGYKYGVFDRK